MSKGEITVKLTQPQVEALLDAVNYCTAGEPNDWGFENDRAGWRKQNTLDRAGTRLWRELAKRDTLPKHTR